MYDVIVIGCGVTGAAAAYHLARFDVRLAVLEANNDVACGATKANSAIIHAGYDPAPGTLMARLNVEGNAMAGEICEKLDVPFARIGSLVAALHEDQTPLLEELYWRGTANGVPGLRLLRQGEVRAAEPNLAGTAAGALYAPSAGVVDPWGFALAMAQTAVRNGAELFLQHPVTAIEPLETGGFCVTTPRGRFETRYLVNAAGVDADRVHAMLEAPSFEIRPSRGEYYLMDKSEAALVRHVVFQCPGPQGKGVLVSPTVHGNLIVGPNAEDTPDRHDVGSTAAGLAEVREKALLSVPGLRFDRNIRNFSGVRANSDRDDFIIERSERWPAFLDLAGIKSPGLSSAPAIGKLAAEMLAEAGLDLRPKAGFCDERKVIRVKDLSQRALDELIREDARYGRVICRCESVTEGEIAAALRGPVPATTVNGVKRRCYAGMGRCQSGFCGPRVQAIIARELGIPPEEVLLEQPGSWMVCGEAGRGKGGANDV